MRIQLTYEQAKKYSKQIAEVVAKQQKSSNAANRKITPAKMKWALDWCVAMKGIGMKFQDIFKEQNPFDYDKRHREWIEGTRAVLEGSVGRSKWYSNPIPGCPVEIQKHYENTTEKDKAEQKRIDALSIPEREAEANEALNELMGMPGFFAVSLNKKKL